ncbi:MAG: LysM peptidoglycan-binding domain-containing protein [Chloroflexota bacterium]
MNRRFFLTLGLVAVLVAFFGLTLPAQASPPPQLAQYSTPTPGPDGRIIYIVQEGDSCTSISLKTGVSIELLLGQNPTLNCDLVVVGQQLLLGLGGPAAYTPTAGPSPTPTIAPPTPTPFAGTTEVCILLYDDVNGDALREETEFGLAGGQVSVTDVNGAYSNTQSTVSAIDPDTEDAVRTCFTDVPEGTFNISMAVPEGYNPTTDISYRLEVKAGDRAFLAFGAQSKTVQAAPEETPPAEGGTNIPWMGILGGILLLGGVVMGWFALRLRKPSSKFGGRGMLK